MNMNQDDKWDSGYVNRGVEGDNNNGELSSYENRIVLNN